MNNIISKSIKKICIIGAGNVGVAFSVDVAARTHKEVVFQTSKADKLNKHFLKFDPESENTLDAEIELFNSYEESLKNADMVICTVPSFLVENVMKVVSIFSPKIVLFVPGYGGKEFYCKKLVDKGCIVAGLSRSPYVARLKNPNYVVASKKKNICVATLNMDYDISGLITDFTGIPCNQINNYLTITFTPSNPILHTARLYSMFKDCDLRTPFNRMIKFYAEWDDLSSETLLKMDDEVLEVCKKLDTFDFSEYVPLKKYYEADSVEKMTEKILSIQSWKNLDSPMKEVNGYFYLDENSRYFKEDFPFGLCILRGFAEIAEVETPYMDKVLKWYEKVFNVQYFDKKGNFNGSDLTKTGTPQNFGIKKMNDVISFYNKFNGTI